MLAPATKIRIRSTNKLQRRKSFARTWMRHALGLCLATSLMAASQDLMAQSCDRCAEPTCGCESSVPKPKKCKPKCTPKPSFAERLFAKADKLGDSIEAKFAKKRVLCDNCLAAASCGCETVAGPNCGCETADPTCGCEAAAPSCGCEACSTPVAYPNPVSHVPAVTKQSGSVSGEQRFAIPSPPRDTGNGSVPANNPPIVRVDKVKQPTAEPLKPAEEPKKRLDSIAEPVLTKVPFEKRSPSAIEPRRIPADESGPSRSSEPTEVKSQNTRSRQNSVPTPSPAFPEPALPDVLIDPFKDDARVRKTRDKMEGVLLTSDRRPSAQGLQLRAAKKANTNAEVESSEEVPPPLTIEQRDSATLQTDPVEPVTSDLSMVVPSSFQQPIPVSVAKRRWSAQPDKAKDEPNVPRIAVPRK